MQALSDCYNYEECADVPLSRFLTKNTLGEMSARCLLWGIMDDDTVYGFDYQKF